MIVMVLVVMVLVVVVSSLNSFVDLHSARPASWPDGGTAMLTTDRRERKREQGKSRGSQRSWFASSGHYCFGRVLLVCSAVRRQLAAEECGQYRCVLAVEAPFPFGPFTEFAPCVDESPSPRATAVTVGIAIASATGS